VSGISVQNLHRTTEERRGRRNFLTWGFFLAQVSAAELLLTGAARAQEEVFLENSMKRSDPGSDDLSTDVAPRRLDVTEAETAASTSNGAAIPNIPSLTDMPLQTEARVSPVAKHAPPDGAAGAAASGTPGAAGAAGSAMPARLGSSGSIDDSLPTLPEINVAGETATAPVSVELGLTPLLGFEVNIADGMISTDVDLDLGSLLVAPPLEKVSLTLELEHLLSGDVLGLGGLQASGSLSLSELTGLSLTADIALLLGPDSEGTPAIPQLRLSAANAEPAAEIVTNASELSAQGLLGSIGVINLPLDASPVPDQLYAQGLHTDYSIALRETADVIDSADHVAPAPDILLSAADQALTATVTELSTVDELVTRLIG
jgi:hypothetical protein